MIRRSLWCMRGIWPCALACLLLPVTAAAADSAEYAIRWAQGGPATTAAVIQLLKLEGMRKMATFTVQYYDLGATPPLAMNELAIGRLRARVGGKVELTYKTRAPLPVPRPDGSAR